MPGNAASGVLFALTCILGAGLRLFLSQEGYNADLESWDIVSTLVLDGKSVYANTYRYPYAPVGMYLLAALKSLALRMELPSIQGFHLVVAGSLTLVDVGIGGLLLRVFGLGAAAFYLLNPVSLLITGYHSQIDNIAVLLGFLGWLALPRDGRSPSWTRFGVSAVLVGASLSIKHVLLLFPVWLVLSERRRTWGLRRLVLYCAICFAIFLGTFAAYLIVYPESGPGMIDFVLRYRGLGDFGKALVPTLLKKATMLIGGGSSLGPISLEDLFRPVFAVGVLVTGWLCRKMTTRDYYLYLVAVTFFSPAIADQYLVIPLLAAAVLSGRWEAWLYTASATWAILGSHTNLGRSARFGPLLAGPVFQWVGRPEAQATLIFLLLGLSLAYRDNRWWRRLWPHETVAS